ncbi:hypothetical protein F5148DRAFT_497315 [Russula earlei]|uniref:Uncharacterized protein n=1 Tax=Russula earlei TaxID=71964 RepID=A0ACC0TY46_9AGAM|nr:hypothetical protein F5148DRAFT_497315 [Russula earlei]
MNTLPDDVLVEIFHFYMNVWEIGSSEWHTLVHVCQKWRYIVFASSRRLNLQLLYTGSRPMSEMLDVWPVLPVVVSLTTFSSYFDPCLGNIATPLESEYHHRICAINLSVIPTSLWERLAAAMQKPFPELTHLHISVEETPVTPLPDSFLDGSAPLLRHLALGNCSFPGIPKLLMSANHLLVLILWNIPDSGYFSPQALVTALSAMSRLESLNLKFRSPRSRPDPPSRSTPPLIRSILSALTYLLFQGVHEYLEDLLAQIEAPLLSTLAITFFMDLDFVVPQLHRLISQAERFKTCDKAFVETSYRAIQFGIFRETPQSPEISLEIRCRELDYQLSSLAQVCGSSLLLSTLVQLDIVDHWHVLPRPHSHRIDDIETTQWLELLDPFTAVKDLRLSNRVARHVCQALEELAEERVTQVLPSLHNVFLRSLQPLESVPKFIVRFVVARQLAGHPVTVYRWENHEKLL